MLKFICQKSAKQKYLTPPPPHPPTSKIIETVKKKDEESPDRSLENSHGMVKFFFKKAQT